MAELISRLLWLYQLVGSYGYIISRLLWLNQLVGSYGSID